MKKVTFLSMFLLATVSLITSCKKDDDDDDDHDGTTAEIVIASPTAGQEFMGGDTVAISATITGTAAMHGWALHLRKVSDQSEVFSADAHDHAASYTIAETWVNNLTEHTELQLEIIATLDHDGNTANKTVNIHCMP